MDSIGGPEVSRRPSPTSSLSLYSFQGGYSAALDGLEIFRYEENKDWSKKSHMFRVQSSPTGNNPLPFDPKMLICAANEKKIRVEIKTDNYGQDTR